VSGADGARPARGGADAGRVYRGTRRPEGGRTGCSRYWQGTPACAERAYA